MSALSMTSREFNPSASEAKRASLSGPVLITDRGKPSHVLLSIEEYRKRAGGMTSLADAMAQHGRDDLDFDVRRVRGLSSFSAHARVAPVALTSHNGGHRWRHSAVDVEDAFRSHCEIRHRNPRKRSMPAPIALFAVK